MSLLKVENLVFQDIGCKHLKICDFGFAAIIAGKDLQETRLLGTPHYMPPEIITIKPHSYPADVWSAGVVLYLMVVGDSPFEDDEENIDAMNFIPLFNKILRDPVEFPSEVSNDLDPDALDLVRKMLCKDQKKRITVESALKHPWMVKDKAGCPHLSKTKERIHGFNERRKAFLTAIKKTIKKIRVSKILMMTPEQLESNNLADDGNKVPEDPSPAQDDIGALQDQSLAK